MKRSRRKESTRLFEDEEREERVDEGEGNFGQMMIQSVLLYLFPGSIVEFPVYNFSRTPLRTLHTISRSCPTSSHEADVTDWRCQVRNSANSCALLLAYDPAFLDRINYGNPEISEADRQHSVVLEA